MRVTRVLFHALLAGVTASAVAAQIPTRPRVQGQATNNSPRLLVANPHSFNAADSAPAVAIGEGLRKAVDKAAGSQFRVLTRQDMNSALVEFGYPADAILAPQPQRNLAQSLNAKVLVSSTLTKDAGGKIVVTSRFAGLNDEAGFVITQSQAAGQSPQDLGDKIGAGFAPVVKSYNDAKACVDQAKNAPAKAADAAKKALNQVPTHGLANYCLGQLAMAKGTKADSAEAMRLFGEAVKGDPLSLNAWTQIAAGYEIAGDTTKTVDALQQMLRIAPTNQPLRDLVFKKLLAYGKPELAEVVADEGLKLDPGNPDLYDLRANARIFRENYNGALSDLEQIIVLDSTRADSTFYMKYLVVATSAPTPDTTRIVHTSSIAARKFPQNTTLFKQVIGAYALVGARDSLQAGLGKLASIDAPSATGYALQMAKERQDAKDFKTADPFIALAAQYGDSTGKESAAGLMFQGIVPLLQSTPPQFQLASDSLRSTLKLLKPTSRLYPILSYYFALATVNVIVAKDKETETAKSCDGAKALDPLVAETEAALTAAAPYVAPGASGAQQKPTYDRLVQYIPSEKTRSASMVKAYCK
jgi:tetratricopeptide (TPR) repeat protein